MTEKHLLLTNQQFEEKFKNCTLSPVLFTHEAHLRLAYIHIKKYGLAKAIKNLCHQISTFDKTFGDGTKFNKTVTIAATKVVYHFINKSKSVDFRGMIEEFPRLKSNFLGLIKSHYTLDIFNDKKAKRVYLEPDLLPFS
ncbi:MAG TPA: hypothetical protein ENK46_03740 [Flavobacteriia bacterium]|jgi:hypothetical protein|nr:hypothetical protein [Flavobacteriia bacterium]